jgi:hypothetical protein
MKRTLLIMMLIAITTACSLKKNEIPKEFFIREDEVESFDIFCESFYSDSPFQMSRIIFPLSSSNIDSSSNDLNESIASAFSKENWTILKNNVFRDKDSIIDVDGRVYKKRISKTKESVIESLYIEDSGCFTTLKFDLIKGKWYLTDFIESYD